MGKMLNINSRPRGGLASYDLNIHYAPNGVKALQSIVRQGVGIIVPHLR
jgi:hypothetical protein